MFDIRINLQAQGQASVEGLIMVSLMVILLSSLHWLGQLRAAALDLLNESTFVAFSGLMAGQSQGIDQLPILDSPYSERYQRVAKELGVDAFVHVRGSASLRAEPVRHIPKRLRQAELDIARHSYVVTGVGVPATLLDAQVVISGAQIIWKDTAALSKGLVSSQSHAMNSTDQVWRRRSWTSDWLNPWAELRP